MNEIDGIAFTRGPGITSLCPFVSSSGYSRGACQGIPGCLSVCGNAARTLAAALNKPLVGVHHMVRLTFCVVILSLARVLSCRRG